jgi:hypothetical protein
VLAVRNWGSSITANLTSNVECKGSRKDRGPPFVYSRCRKTKSGYKLVDIT